MFDSKLKKYIQKAVQNIEMTSKFTGLRNTNSRANYVLMLIKDGLEFMIKKTNEAINYHNNSATTMIFKEKLTLPTMMKWTAIHMASSQSSLSPSAIVEIFQQAKLTTISHLEYVQISNDLIITDASNHININKLSWKCGYDKTHELGPYEEVVFKAAKDIYFIPNLLNSTLDDDMIGSRSKEVQVKSLSQRKAAKEGHTADVLSEFFFRLLSNLGSEGLEKVKLRMSTN